MLIDANSLDNKASLLDSDICIIGAGAAGITIAKQFLNTSIKVLLVESGGFEFEENVQSMYKGENVGIPYDFTYSRLRYFGGTTNHWAGWCAPFDHIIFNKREWVPNASWPITRKDLDPYWKRASELVEISKFDYDYNNWDKDIRPVTDNIEYRMWQVSPPTRFGKKYRKEIVDSKNVTILLNANVLNIKTSDNAKEVTGLDIKTLDKKELTVKSKRYVLASGAIESTRLLMLSKDTVSQGLGNQNDVLGRYFFEHVYMPVGQLFYAPSKKHVLVGGRRLNNTNLIPNYTFSEEAQRKHKLLNTAFNTVRSRRPVSDFIDKATVEFLSKAVNLRQKLTAVATVDLKMEASPNKESRILLSEKSKDQFDLPRTKLDWRVNSSDFPKMQRSVNMLSEQFGKTGLGVLRLQDWVHQKKDWPKKVLGGAHHMGGLRMSEDPKLGVVDKNCKMHGTENLYVVGSGVYPSVGWSNPTFTIVNLSLRLADHLKSTAHS